MRASLVEKCQLMLTAASLRWGLSYRAAASPPCMNACLTRDTVLEHTCSAWAIAWLELVLLLSPLLPLPLAPTLLSAAISSIRALVCTLAGLLPEFTDFLRVVRSSLVSLIFGAVLRLPVYQIPE